MLLVADLASDDAERARISNRSGLIHALTEAAELEHGLMVQYLFAAFTIRKRQDEGLTIAEMEMLRRSEAAILQVAREEMAHLATVCNLLTAVGGAPHFRRPNLPVPGRYFPHVAPGRAIDSPPSYRPFTLMPFSLATLKRFIAFEAPYTTPWAEGFLPLQPDLRYATIGRLYGQILDAFREMKPPGGLFVGARQAQDADNWTAAMELLPVTHLGSAKAAVGFIVSQGEGTATSSSRCYSHWQCFRRIYDNVSAACEGRPGFNPSRHVVPNPMTRAHDGDEATIAVDHPDTVPVSELFNWVYATVLLMLMQFYAFAGETDEQRERLRATIRRTMSGVIRPLGEILTELPARVGSDRWMAGPSFELYTDLRLPALPSTAWTIFTERLHEAAEACAELHAAGGPARLLIVTEHLRIAAREVDSIRPRP